MPREWSVVVEEEDQVAEADQRVGAVARPGQRVGPAVHVADHMNPHAVTNHRRRARADRPHADGHADARSPRRRWRARAGGNARNTWVTRSTGRSLPR